MSPLLSLPPPLKSTGHTPKGTRPHNKLLAKGPPTEYVCGDVVFLDLMFSFISNSLLHVLSISFLAAYDTQLDVEEGVIKEATGTGFIARRLLVS